MQESEQSKAPQADHEQHQGKRVHVDTCNLRTDELAQRTWDQDPAPTGREGPHRSGSGDKPASDDPNGAGGVTAEKGKAAEDGEYTEDDGEGDRHG